MLIDIFHFRHHVWRLIIVACVCINMWEKSLHILQNSKSSAHSDSVGISGLCLDSSSVVLAIKTKNIKWLIEISEDHYWWCKPSHWCKS